MGAVPALHNERNVLRKVMIMVAVAAMLVSAAAPAFAGDRHHNDWDNDWERNDQIDFDDLEDFLDDNNNDGSEQEADSGDISQVFTVVNTGDNANQCVGSVLNANTGSSQSQFTGTGETDVDDSGSSLDVFGEATTTCDQAVDQTALVY